MKTLIISGATGTIGAAICYAFAERNYHITMLVRNKKKCDELSYALKKKFPSIDRQVVAIDLCDEQQILSAFQAHKTYFGVAPNAVIHAAATQLPIGLVWEVDAKELTQSININLLSSFLMTRSAIQLALKNSSVCSIVLFSGGGSCYARPYFSAYGACKTAILRLVETTAEELHLEKLDEKIQINALAPGAVFSNMTQQIMNAGNKAGKTALSEAKNLNNNEHTSEDAVKLCLFLADREKNFGLNGRLIHAKEPYLQYATQVEKIQKSDQGLLRRVMIHEQ